VLVLAGLLACTSPPPARHVTPATCRPGSPTAPRSTARRCSPAAPPPARRRGASHARDIKVFDDELRFAILSFCQPCGGWVGDRLTIEAMFPLQRLDMPSMASAWPRACATARPPTATRARRLPLTACRRVT